MSAYNFKRQFALAVKSGRKRSTIRGRRKNGYVPTVGEKIKLYTGMRTKDCRLLRTVKVKRVTPIVIDETEYYTGRIIINGKPLDQDVAFETIVKPDGFNTWLDFASFFKSSYGFSFAGYLIEW